MGVLSSIDLLLNITKELSEGISKGRKQSDENADENEKRINISKIIMRVFVQNYNTVLVCIQLLKQHVRSSRANK
jgi:hypothetical protein